MWKKNYRSEVSARHPESVVCVCVWWIISRQRGSFSQHSAYNYYVCLLYPGLKNLTDHGEKNKETDHFDSGVSCDDCNLAIQVGSLEEEACELQALKVWGASEQTRMGIPQSPGLHLDLITMVSSLEEREKNKALLTSFFNSL